MTDAVQPLPAASDNLQQKFTDLRLPDMAPEGHSPLDILTKTLNQHPELLEYTFTGRDGKKTNFVAELIRNDKPALAAMVVKEFKLPEAMIKGYKPDEKSPEINLLSLSLQHSSSPDLTIRLLEKGATLENAGPDGGNIMHTMMSSAYPGKIKRVLEHLDKNTTPEQRNALFAQKNAVGKTPLELITSAPNIVPFFEHGYVSKPEVEKKIDGWIAARQTALDTRNTLDEGFTQQFSELLGVHEAAKKAGVPRNISTDVGKQLVGFGRNSPLNADYCLLNLTSMCEHASEESKNAWFAAALPYQMDNRFSLAASKMLYEKGAKATDLKVIKDAVYAENIELVRYALDSCKSKPDFMDQGTESSLQYAIECGFAAEQKRMPIVALLAQRGAKVNEQTYDAPMRDKIGCLNMGSQCALITRCQALRLPYPQGLIEVMEKHWTEYDQVNPPNEKMLKERQDLRMNMGNWERSEGMRKVLRDASGFAPEIVPAKEFAGLDLDFNNLSAAIPEAVRKMAKVPAL